MLFDDVAYVAEYEESGHHSLVTDCIKAMPKIVLNTECYLRTHTQKDIRKSPNMM